MLSALKGKRPLVKQEPLEEEEEDVDMMKVKLEPRDEEETAEQHGPKRPRLADTGQSALLRAAPVDNHSDMMTARPMKASSIPRLKHISELLSDCPNLEQNIDGSPLCPVQRGALGARASPPPAAAATAAANPSRAGAVPAAAAQRASSDLQQALDLVRRAGAPDPNGHWVAEEYNRLLSQLVVPQFYAAEGMATPYSQHALEQELQRGQRVLPILSAELECLLMAESGTFTAKSSGKVVTFPPCRNGANCVGMTDPFRNQPRRFVFTMIFTEQEYEYFTITGKIPQYPRPCIPCARQHLTACIVFDRAVRMCGDAAVASTPAAAAAAASPSMDTTTSSVLRVQREGILIQQFYQNVCDGPHGYKKECMLRNNHHPDDPLLQPICLPSRSLLFCKPSATHVDSTGAPRVVVDQTALLWTPAARLQPAVGQNLLNFCKGASKH
jgi:hypothetical protein